MWRFEEQKSRYGGHLFIKDDDGYFCCFFKLCGMKIRDNFSLHIELHELSEDSVDDDFVKINQTRYRTKPESSITPSTLRVKSSLARPREEEVSWLVCREALHSLCSISDQSKLPSPLTNAQALGVYPAREYALSNSIGNTMSQFYFEPLKTHCFPVQQSPTTTLFSNTISNNPNASININSKDAGGHLSGSNQTSSLDLGIVLRKLVNNPNSPSSPPEYKDIEDFCMDVRHALNFVRVSASYATPSAPVSSKTLINHTKMLYQTFMYFMEKERLAQKDRIAEKKLKDKFGQIELSFSLISQLLQSIASNPMAGTFMQSPHQKSSEIHCSNGAVVKSYESGLHFPDSLSRNRDVSQNLTPTVPTLLHDLKSNLINFNLIYNNLLSGKYACNPGLLFCRDVRNMFKQALLHHEPGNTFYDHAMALSSSFESLVESMYEKAARQLQAHFRFTVRDDSHSLLVWDQVERQFYKEYFEENQASNQVTDYQYKQFLQDEKNREKEYQEKTFCSSPTSNTDTLTTQSRNNSAMEKNQLMKLKSKNHYLASCRFLSPPTQQQQHNQQHNQQQHSQQQSSNFTQNSSTYGNASHSSPSSSYSALGNQSHSPYQLNSGNRTLVSTPTTLKGSIQTSTLHSRQYGNMSSAAASSSFSSSSTMGSTPTNNGFVSASSNTGFGSSNSSIHQKFSSHPNQHNSF